MKQEKNLSQYVPQAPMALASYQDFVTQDKDAMYPFKQSKGLTPVFKVVLNNQGIVLINNTYVFNVNLSQAQGKVLRCGIASIIANGNITSAPVYNLHLNPLVQMRSFDSRTRGITDMIFTGRAGVDYVFPVNQADCNFEVDAEAVRSTNSLTLYFTDINGARISALNTFQITLYFYSAEN